MSEKKQSQTPQNYKKTIATNKKALFNYFIEEKLEAGIVLKGSEVKSLRVSGCNIEDSHADVMNSEVFLFNLNIPEYKKANSFATHSPRAPRKLLVKKKERKKFIGKIKQKGYTLIAMSIYFNHKSLVKVELALAKGKKLHDKRQDLKEKDWNREQAKILRIKR
ncbi:MAG: SsrA-binding protein SmpB [Rickettsiaceae bacterium]|nr:SsrA-binding protein SmpB [Rickettsiaceae bacterium]